MKKVYKRIAQATVAIALVSGIFLASNSVDAAGRGQIVGGNQNYKIANITKDRDFANPQTADACDVLQYRIRLYNPGPSALSNVKIEASINTMTKYTAANSTATIYAPDAVNPAVAMQAVVNISTPQTQSYVNGSTKLLNSAGSVTQNLPDGITMGGGGISVGAIGDSVTEYVVFSTKLKCTPPPECVNNPATPEDECHPCVNNPHTPQDECHPCVNNPQTPEDECHPCVNNPKTPQDECNPCKDNPNTSEDECHPCIDNPKTDMNECKPETPKTPKPPKSLPNTGPGNIAAIFTGVTVSSSLAYHIVRRRFGL